MDESMAHVKPFILLIGNTYYPDRWKDFRWNVETLERAVEVVNNFEKAGYWDWWQIIDLRTMAVVLKGEYK